LENPGIKGNITVKWIFEKWGVGAETGSTWLRIGTGGGAFVNVVMNFQAP
jgi:hypothetical protein